MSRCGSKGEVGTMHKMRGRKRLGVELLLQVHRCEKFGLEGGGEGGGGRRWRRRGIHGIDQKIGAKWVCCVHEDHVL